MKILIIEDEFRLADLLSDWFSKQGMETEVCNTGDAGLTAFLRGGADVVISDVMLPGMDGFEILRRARVAGVTTPVLMLTARTELSDKLEGFAAGAEDYLTKPFEIEELDARVRILTRKITPSIEEVQTESNRLVCDDLVLELNADTIMSTRTGKSVRLTRKEYELLEYFMRNRDQLLSKEMITTSIWGYETDVSYNNEEVYMSFLRRKMKFIGTNMKIETIRGAGYRLRKVDG